MKKFGKAIRTYFNIECIVVVKMAVHQVLSNISRGREVYLSKMNFASDSVIQRLGELGLFEGSKVEVLNNQQHNAPLLIDQAGNQVIISRKLADRITVIEE